MYGMRSSARKTVRSRELQTNAGLNILKTKAHQERDGERIPRTKQKVNEISPVCATFPLTSREGPLRGPAKTLGAAFIVECGLRQYLSLHRRLPHDAWLANPDLMLTRFLHRHPLDSSQIQPSGIGIRIKPVRPTGRTISRRSSHSMVRQCKSWKTWRRSERIARLLRLVTTCLRGRIIVHCEVTRQG